MISLRTSAEAAGRELAERLASHILPDHPWLDELDAQSEAILKCVSELTSDPRLIDELAAVCADAARTRWEQLRQLRSSSD